MEKPSWTLTFTKRGEIFIFRCEKGREDELLDALIDQAKNNGTSFDWFDASVLCWRLHQLLIGQAMSF